MTNINEYYNQLINELDDDYILKLKAMAEKMLMSFLDCRSDEETIKNKKSFYYILKTKCESLGIVINENVSEELELEMKKISDNVNINNSNNININATKDNYEELITQAFQYNEDKKKQNIILDLLLNVEIKREHGIAYGIMDSLREMDCSDFYNDVYNMIQELFEEKNSEYDAIFGSSELNKENCSLIMHKLFFYMELSNVLMVRNKYKKEYEIVRSRNVIDIFKSEHPEFYDELCELTNLSEEYDLYYHGTDSNYISEKICNEGLFMQYGDISRTAVNGLTPEQIINYSYGHEGVGRHSIVLIAVPKGDYPIVPNNDESIRVQGTGQGQAGIDSFNPKYVIPQNYIYGIIDKDNFQFINNPFFDKHVGIKR